MSADLPTADQWSRLTLAPGKQDAFSTDLYFREGWAEVDELADERAASAFFDVALLAFKPDATVGRRMTPTVTYLREHGFVPIAVATVRHTRHSVRELYRFTWDIYTMDRLALAITMHTSRETLLLMLRDTRRDGGVPASVRLSELKGSSDPKQRTSKQLRTVLEPPHEIINFVHVADEPADVIRELAVYMTATPRRRLIQRIVSADISADMGEEVTRQIANIERGIAPHDFDTDAALRRLVENGSLSRDQRRLLSLTRKITWRELCSVMEPTDKNLWDFVSIAAVALELRRRGTVDLLPRARTPEWRAHADQHHSKEA
jgi:hypothetical protein